MIHPATNVHVLSTEGGNNIEGAIESVIRIYSSIIDYHDINDGVDFSLILAQPNIGSKLKITDWTGWTDIFSIERHKYNGKWYEITIENGNNKIYVTEDELIPVYKTEDVKRGFHGEIKYSYILKSPSKIESSDYMRFRKVYNDDPDYSYDLTFEPVIIKECKGPEYAYKIITRSKFYNAFGMHLWGCNDIPVTEVQKWYK